MRREGKNKTKYNENTAKLQKERSRRERRTNEGSKEEEDMNRKKTNHRG